MSFSSEVEHIWLAEVPETLQGIFPNGVCAVFSDEQFTAAIPATNDETNDLADLFEIAATGGITNDEPAMKAYNLLRDKLCSPKGYQMLSKLFKQELDKDHRASMLACAARN